MVYAVILICIASLTSWLSWSGFHASDDIGYYEAAKGWLAQGAYVPISFWEVRSTTTWPIAGSIALLGDTEFATVLPSVLYMIGLLLLTQWQLSRLIQPPHAFVATAVLATLPVLTLNAGWPSADMPQIFWAAVAFWCLAAATRDATVKPGLLILVGAAIALAFMGRETVIALVLAIGVLFLAGYRIPRWAYCIGGIGFFAVIGGEALYFWILTGNPLHRFDMLTSVAGTEDRPRNVPFFTIDSSGALRVWNPIDPILLLFAKHEFGVINWVIAPLAIGVATAWLRRFHSREAAPEWFAVAQLALLVGVIWILVNMLLLMNIAILARYYLPPTYFLFISAALWASRIAWPRYAVPLSIALATVVALNLVGIALDDRNSRAGERAVARYLQTTSERLRTDPYTAWRSRWYVQWAGQDHSRVDGAPPQPGDLFLYNRTNAAQPNRLLPATDLPLYRPQPGWQTVWTWQSEVNPIGRILVAVGLGSIIPAPLRTKLTEPRHVIGVYRIPGT